MPGNTDFLPPENPAKKWASINPSEINKSASAATLLIMQSPPLGNCPILTMAESSVDTCITISSFLTISSPYLATSSSCVLGL